MATNLFVILAILLPRLLLGFTIDGLVSQDPGCVTETKSKVNGYYVSLGRCGNFTVYMQQNKTTYSASTDASVYIIYYGEFVVDQSVDDTSGDTRDNSMTAYGFYSCPSKDSYALNGEMDNNNDNSGSCLSPNDYGNGCTGVPTIYCAQEDEPEWDKDTTDGLYTFSDYCHEWKKHDSSVADEVIEFLFLENEKCPDSAGTQGNIPDSTGGFDPSGNNNNNNNSNDPNSMSEQLTNAWAILGILIGVVVIIIGFILMLKRGKYIWELRRSNQPVVLPMGSETDNTNKKSNKKHKQKRKHKTKRNGHVTIDDIEEDDDDIDEELGAVIVSRGIHKNIHSNTNHSMLRHIPEQPAPPIPMSNNNNNNNNNNNDTNELISPRDGSTIDNEMLHESMISLEDENDNDRSNHVNHHKNHSDIDDVELEMTGNHVNKHDDNS